MKGKLSNPIKFKSKKVFIDYNNPLTQLGIEIVMLKNPKYELYRLNTYFFGLLSFWEYRMTLYVDPKTYLNVIDSNY